MRRLSRDLVGFAVAGPRQITIWIHTGTVRRFGRSPGTPVATGEARSGGRVGLNRKPTFRPTPGGSFYSPAGTDHIDRALAGMKLGDTIFWRNRVQHASVLEGGRRFSSRLGRMVGSDQAPEGFLGLAVEEARARLRGWRYQPRNAA